MRQRANRTNCAAHPLHPRVLAAFAAGLLLAAAPAAAQRPASYAEFDVGVAAGDGAVLTAAITSGQRNYLYLRPGYYLLDNPVVIDRGTPLFVHGADRQSVILAAKNARQPLFLVRNAPLLNFAGVHLWANAQAGATLNARAVSSVNAQPVALEFQDCIVEQSTLLFAGPGSYRVQGCFFAPGGRVRAPIEIDHPGADVLVFGGDATNGAEPLRTADYAHVWQKRGRLRVYATTFEGGLGPADVRIEAGSALGPHVIANIRSEGANGALDQTGAISRLLYVPPTSERVDVVLKSNGGAWQGGPTTSRDTRVNCRLVWYNGAGTLWLLGNRAGEFCGRHLVEGEAPQATIVSVGNLTTSPETFRVNAGRIISAADAFDSMMWTGLRINPWVRWVPNGSRPAKLASHPNVPQPPQDVLPASLDRPIVTAALPGMLDVKAFGARGDGSTDDTAAIQRALDAQCDGDTSKILFFPAGTYRVRNTLYLNHHVGGSCHGRLPSGGWIAGAGSTRTVIAMDPAVKKGTFATDGLTFATVQGITFKTWAWRAGDPQEPNVDLEYYPGYQATQQNHFYDVVFDGGYAALAAGVRYPSPGNCSSIAVFRGRLANAHIGFVSGHYSALANLVYDSELIDNDYALGSWTADPSRLPAGGTTYAYRSTSRGSRVRDFEFAGSATGTTFYFYEWTSDAPSYFSKINTAGPFPQMFERSRLSPRPGVEFPFDVGTSQGPIFLYSSLTGGRIRVGQSGMGQSYAVKIESDISSWGSSVESVPNGILEEISWSAPASIGAPGRPVVVD